MKTSRNVSTFFGAPIATRRPAFAKKGRGASDCFFGGRQKAVAFTDHCQGAGPFTLRLRSPKGSAVYLLENRKVKSQLQLFLNADQAKATDFQNGGKNDGDSCWPIGKF